MGEAASRAEAFVRRARWRLTAHAVVRAALAGVASAALTATAILALLRLSGVESGPWPVLGVAVGLAVVLLRLRRARPSRNAAALVLDRAAGTQERFLAAVTARDPDVRDFAACQAIDRSGMAEGRRPLRLPPSVEGLAAVLSVACLAGTLLLVSPAGPDRDPDGQVTAAVPGATGTEAPGPGAERVEPPAGAMVKTPGPPVVERIEGGEDLSDEDWRELSAAGLTDEEREAIRTALAAGDREGAAEKARAGLRRASGEPARPSEGEPGTWGAYGQALSSPGWPHRHDRVVREYFRVSGQRGLR